MRKNTQEADEGSYFQSVTALTAVFLLFTDPQLILESPPAPGVQWGERRFLLREA